MDTYLWGVLVTYHWYVVEWFIWDMFETSWRLTDETSLYVFLKHHYNVPINAVETYQQVVLVTFHRDVVGCFIWDVTATLLLRTERYHYDVATTSCCQLGCYVTAKHRGAACRYWNVNLNCKIPIAFHDLKNYDAHVLAQELGKFDSKINVKPKWSENVWSLAVVIS